MHGLDRREAFVDALRTLYPRVRFQACDLNRDRLPFEDASVEVVFCSNVLEHVAYPDKAVREAARIVSPVGRVVIAVPPIDSVGEVSENARNPFHITNLPSRTWQTKLERFFESVTPVRHWVHDENRLPMDTKALLGLGTGYDRGLIRGRRLFISRLRQQQGRADHHCHLLLFSPEINTAAALA